MKDLVVGNSDCDFGEVTLVITEAVPAPKPGQVMKLMRRLKTKSVTKTQIENKLNLISGYSVPDAIQEILEDWRSEQSNKATLRLLILYLKACGLKSHADALKNRFLPNQIEMETIEMANQQDIFQVNDTNKFTSYNTDTENGSLSEETSAETHMVPNPSAQITEAIVGPSIITNQLGRKIKPILLIVIGLLVAIGMGIGLYFLIMKLFYPTNLNNPEKLTSSNLSKVVQSDMILEKLTPPELKTRQCKQIFLSHEWSSSPHGEDPICLVIQSSREMNWSITSMPFKTEHVLDITIEGCTHPSLVVAILLQFHLVRNLTIKNEGGTYCDSTNFNDEVQGTGKTFKVSLKNLLSINMFNMTNNAEILKVISNLFVMPNVVFLKLSHFNVHDKNIFWVRNFLKQIRFSVEILDFFNTSWETTLFHNMKFKFTSLYELKIDFLCKRTYGCSILGDLPSRAPILRRLISNRGYLSLEENNLIMQLKEAEYLHYRIRVCKNDNILNVAILTNSLTKLKHITLYVSFEDLKSCHIAGQNMISSDLLILGTNCMEPNYIDN